MKKTVLVLLTFVFTFTLFAQEQTNEFRVNDMSFSLVLPRSNKINNGLGMGLELTFVKNNHLFKLQASGASEFSLGLFENVKPRDNFREFNLFYGRSFKIKNWVAFDVFGGIGYIAVEHSEEDNNSNTYIKTKEKSIGFPIQGKVRFIASKTISMGLYHQTNFSKITTLNSFGTFFQFNF